MGSSESARKQLIFLEDSGFDVWAFMSSWSLCGGFMPKRLAWVTGGGFLLAAFGCLLETLVPEVATGTCSSLRG